MFEKMEKTFDLIPAPPELLDAVAPEPDDEDTDDELVKTTLRGLIDTTSTLIEDLSVIAKTSEHPRAYEVAATLIKTMADVAGKLSELTAKQVKGAPTSAEPQQVTNQNLFVGSTEELMDLLKDMSQRPK